MTASENVLNLVKIFIKPFILNEEVFISFCASVPIYDKVFKNGTRKISGIQPLKRYALI